MEGSAEWDARYRSGDHSGSSPDPFLPSVSSLLEALPAEAVALDLACGSGRHAIWLAERHFRVTAIDFSAEALAKGKRLAGEHNVSVEWRDADLESPHIELGSESYDLICGFFFLYRPLFPKLQAALRPGGLLVYKTYSIDQLRYPGRPRHPMYLLEHNELLKLVSPFRVLQYEERWQPSGTAAIMARKPGG